MADDFENFTTFTASTVHDPHQSTEAWGNWPAFNEEPPPISDDSEDEEFGKEINYNQLLVRVVLYFTLKLGSNTN